MPQRLRVFVSSPGDVPDERLRADLVIDRLAQDYSRFFTIEAYRWEHEPMLASGHFQDAIDPPSVFDIVILILWSRLGTNLPEKTTVRAYTGIDGRTPITGTEWEFEDALRMARERGAPDILAFRNVTPALVDTLDPAEQERNLAQLKALNAFWTRHFADRGVFLSAYDSYRTLEEFAERLERSLRKLIERRIKDLGAQQQMAPAIKIWLQSPFRGLENYEFEHAAIYFGRDALVAKATEQLASQARAGAAFLLVSGASGSGKSSLVKAGVMPRLMKPQRIQGAAFVRRLSFRPSAGGGDVILGLVEALTRAPPSPDVGLPELLGPGQSAADLAKHLRAAVDEPGFVLAGALGRVTEAGRKSGHILRYEEAKLILLIDQLEELFTVAAIPVDDQRLFIRLLAGLARSRAVWVVATIRSDFWHRAAEIPELIALCAGNGRIDVAAPSQAEIVEMIRKPALVSGLAFDVHEKTGLGLDAVLAQDAATEPGVLPLLSFTLDALYVADVQNKGGHVLLHATYETLGGLEGAITKRADEVVAGLPEATQKALPRVLRSLATASAANQGPAVARAVPLQMFPEGGAARELIEALTSARLLVVSTEGTVPTVRLAHEALIKSWERAAAQLAADRRDLETRSLIERQCGRWASASGPARHQLLLRDPDLANAVDLDRRWGDELTDDLRAFISRSNAAAKAAARRRWAIAAVVMLCLAGLAAASFAALYVAEIQRDEAMIAQSRFLARDARAAVDDGNATLGTILALAGLPHDIRNPDRPFVNEAEDALEDALANRRESSILRGHQGAVATAAFSPDGTRAVTASNDNTARLWNTRTGAPITVLSGHDDNVSSAAFSPNGKQVVTASDDRTARIWDAVTGAPIAVLRGHEDIVTSAVFSPDSKRIVTASDDKTARVWDSASGALIAVLQGHQGLVNSAAFSPDSKHVVTAATDNTARVWDAATGVTLSVLKGHRNFVNAAAFSPDGTHVATASWDKTARLWDAATGAALAVLGPHDGRVWFAVFSPDGGHVVTASEDKTARVWDAKSGAATARLKGHENWVNSVAFSPDGTHVVTASDDKTSRLWDADKGNAMGVLRGHESLVNSAVFSPDGTSVLTASGDATARLWKTGTEAAAGILQGHTAAVNSAVFSPDDARVATASFDRTARLWNARDGALLVTFQGHNDTVWSMAFSPDGKRVVTGSDDKTARIWDAQTGDAMIVLPHDDRVDSAAFSPDGKRVVTTSTDHTATIWDAQAGTKMTVLRGHADWVTSAAFSPDGRRVVTGSYDKTARIWDAETGAAILVLKGHENRINSAVFSPDGKRVATASWDDTARIWDANTGEPMVVVRGHENWVISAAFSPDGMRLVTASWDQTVRVWDASTGAAIVLLSGHEGKVTFASFSADGKRVVSASYDQTARLWVLPPHCQSLIDEAQKELPRGPLPREREQYFLEGRPSGASALSAINKWFAPVLPGSGDACL